MTHRAKVVIIGAGPAGSIAAALLLKKGYQVTVLERDIFPRFCIGESLLPQCMEFIKEAGMLEAVKAANFQLKTGAVFINNRCSAEFDFVDKFNDGFNYTYQVQRDRFDTLLAEQAISFGAEIHWQTTVIDADFESGLPTLTIENKTGHSDQIEADFVLDASGFGRVLPRLLDLETPSNFPHRQALFTHIEDRICEDNYDRNKTYILVHPEIKDIWYWLIPFSNGRCSLGVVGESTLFESIDSDNTLAFKKLLGVEPNLSRLLNQADFDTPVQSIGGYSARVKSLYGDGFALLGNAGEFLDPVFSSGVAIAMKSASLAADILDRQFKQETVDWQTEFTEPLQVGVETFRTFVQAWYDGRLQDVVFFQRQQNDRQMATIRELLSSVFAGYVWDKNNPYVKNPESRLRTLVEMCRNPDLN